jgi:hypothetical protein
MKFVYDCDKGQGLVEAKNIEDAERIARRECGSYDPPRMIRKATKEDLEWRKAMGGTA